MFPGMFGGGSYTSVMYTPGFTYLPGSEELQSMLTAQWIRIDVDYKSKVEAAHGSWYPLGLPSDTGIRAIAMGRTSDAENALISTQDFVNTNILVYQYFELPQLILTLPTIYGTIDVQYGAIHSPLYSLDGNPPLRIDGQLLAKVTDVPAPPVTAVYGSN